jgi:curved DNA-binding protein CbpA
MSKITDFIDYYELLEISPNASLDTIDIVFRHFARRFHPDNRETGNRQRFDVVMEAHDILKNPAKRADYDRRRKSQLKDGVDGTPPTGDRGEVGRDIDVQSRLLSVLYEKRRQSAKNPGIGDVHLEFLVACHTAHLEFHIWYLKEKGWILRTEDGTLAITAEGVDHINSEYHRKATERLLTVRNGLA